MKNPLAAEFKNATFESLLKDSVSEGISGWEKDRQWQLSDECVSENIIANEYEFTKEGKRA